MTALEHIDGRREGRVASHNTETHVIPEVAAEQWIDLARALAASEVDPPCAERPGWWFASGAGAGDLTEAAVHGCGRCPVAVPCAAYAEAAGEREGVWGGTTPAERDAERRAAREARRREGRRTA